MAVFSAGAHLPVNFWYLNLTDFSNGTLVNPTGSHFSVLTPQTRSEVYGTGFGYSYGRPATGSLIARGEYLNGEFYYGIIGINVPVSVSSDWLTALKVAFAGADDIAGSPHDDELLGMGGNDFIRGFEGNDVLRGGVGNDYLDGGNGIDGMYGNDGDDAYVVLNAGDGVVEEVFASGGTDTVFSHISYELPANVENLQLLGPALSATGNGSDNLIFGNEEANAIDGAMGSDTIYGFDGADALFGGLEPDALYGGDGNDVINGWFGSDFLSGEDGDDTLFGSTGNDTILGGTGDDILAGEHYAESATPNPFDQSSRDHILGGLGDDLIIGGADNDRLNGEFDEDVIYGGSGNDIIIGGPGADALDGGLDIDTFMYVSIADYYPAGADTIANFSTDPWVHDRFDLVQLFDAVGAPTLTVADARAQGWLRVIQDGSDALVQVDINGGGNNFGTVARLPNITAVSVTDSMFLI